MNERELVERVARHRKVRRLAADPMMDAVAVRLNCEPQDREIEDVRQFIADLRTCGALITVVREVPSRG